MGSIVVLRSNGSTPTVGVGAYSEGLNDDLNKVVWSAMAEDSRLTVGEVVAQYARHFFGAENEELAVAGLGALERAWSGPPDPSLAEETLQTWTTIASLSWSPTVESNWRLLMYLHRATFDAYVAERFVVEEARLKSALDALRRARTLGSIPACEAAMKALTTTVATPRTVELRAQLTSLVQQLNKTIGAEVLQSQVRPTLDLP
jgi:hypothetical protein